MNKNEILDYVKNLDGFEGYISPLSTKLDESLIFDFGDKISFDGIIFEAHFFNPSSKKSIQIRLVNDAWLISETELDKVDESDIKSFHTKFGKKVKMAQIWREENDEYCENKAVLKLQKVVFAGFVKDKK
ncbi:MAG: TIGR04423 family type III CRISPR-associated protein [Campylobacter sp.]|nr:TIGR04423 family type III CRISPR-associated protein [Campylobacter sp.]